MAGIDRHHLNKRINHPTPLRLTTAANIARAFAECGCRLVLQMLIESLLVAVGGGLLAVPVAVLSARALVSFIDTTTSPVALSLTIDGELSKLVRAEKNILLTEDLRLNQEFSETIVRGQNTVENLINQGATLADTPEEKAAWA